MISPEQLRRYQFFGFLTPEQLREVAMIAEEIEVPAGVVLFSIGEPADNLFFLLKGSVELHYVVVDEYLPQLRKDFLIGTVNPGEVMGISSLVEPYELTSTAVTNTDCKLLRFESQELRDLCDRDHDLAYGWQRQMAQTSMNRLHATRVLLAAANAP